MTLALVALVACHDETSEFPKEGDVYSRRILDHVFAGTESVVGADVYIEPTPGLLEDNDKRAAATAATGYPGVYTSTDPSGRFSQLDGPIIYDLAIHKGLDIGVFRDVDRRGWDIPFLPDGPVTGFSSTLTASTSPAPIEGHSVAYFLVTGTDAKTLANGFGDAGPSGTLVATYAQYTSSMTLAAVEYETANGLTRPTAKGTIDLTLTNGIGASPVVTMTPISDYERLRGPMLDRVASFALADPPPPGFVFDDVDLYYSFGIRRDARPIGHVALGTELPLSITSGGTYWARLTATRADGAKIDTGLFFFQIYLPVDATTYATTPAALPLALPLLGSTFDGVHSFTATFPVSTGLVEHVLVPADATRPTVRILTPEAPATLDDIPAFGGPAFTGTYTWTTNYYSSITSTVDFFGTDARYIVPFSTTAPKTIVLK